MKYKQFINRAFGQNTFVIWCETSSEAAVIDPGMMTDSEYLAVTDFIDDNGLKLKYVLITHAHIDHACAARKIANQYGVAVTGAVADQDLAEKLPWQASYFGLPLNLEPLKIDAAINDGDVISLGQLEIHVLATPGHSKGGVVFYLPAQCIAFVGDTIFAGSVGRTDFLGGNQQTLIESIEQKLMTLPPETKLVPGHGPQTTVATEAATNPFL